MSYLVLYRILNAAELVRVIDVVVKAFNQPWLERKLKTIFQV
jgi:hypothetical protein